MQMYIVMVDIQSVHGVIRMCTGKTNAKLQFSDK